MDSFIFHESDNDVLMEEALVILDSIDVEQLGAEAPESTSAVQENLDEKAAADDLLTAAIQAVHAAFPHNGIHSSIAEIPQQNKFVKPEQHDNQNITTKTGGRSESDPLHQQTAANNTGKTTPSTRRSEGGRTRMREQLIQLRSVVQKMENHLETLRSPRSPRFDARADTVEDGEAGANLAGDENKSNRMNVFDEAADEALVWRSIAMQQFRARRKAEQENADLRQNLAAQIHLSKQMETLLQAQPPHSVSTLYTDESVCKLINYVLCCFCCVRAC